MINIEDRNYQPSIEEMCKSVGKPLFNELCLYMRTEYSAIQKVEYSGDKVLLGWNIKFKKAGRTLCTVYPRCGHFYMLLVVGRKEKERVEALLPEFSTEFRDKYISTKEGMGQRWIIFDFNEKTDTYKNALSVVHIRRQNKV